MLASNAADVSASAASNLPRWALASPRAVSSTETTRTCPLVPARRSARSACATPEAEAFDVALGEDEARGHGQPPGQLFVGHRVDQAGRAVECPAGLVDAGAVVVPGRGGAAGRAPS